MYRTTETWAEFFRLHARYLCTHISGMPVCLQLPGVAAKNAAWEKPGRTEEAKAGGRGSL